MSANSYIKDRLIKFATITRELTRIISSRGNNSSVRKKIRGALPRCHLRTKLGAVCRLDVHGYAWTVHQKRSRPLLLQERAHAAAVTRGVIVPHDSCPAPGITTALIGGLSYAVLLECLRSRYYVSRVRE